MLGNTSTTILWTCRYSHSYTDCQYAAGKTDFNMADIKKEESEYMPLPKFYTFKSRDERERILYKNFVQVGEDVKAMIAEIFNKKNAK